MLTETRPHQHGKLAKGCYRKISNLCDRSVEVFWHYTKYFYLTLVTESSGISILGSNVPLEGSLDRRVLCRSTWNTHNSGDHPSSMKVAMIYSFRKVNLTQRMKMKYDKATWQVAYCYQATSIVASKQQAWTESVIPYSQHCLCTLSLCAYSIAIQILSRYCLFSDHTTKVQQFCGKIWSLNLFAPHIFTRKAYKKALGSFLCIDMAYLSSWICYIPCIKARDPLHFYGMDRTRPFRSFKLLHGTCVYFTRCKICWDYIYSTVR